MQKLFLLRTAKYWTQINNMHSHQAKKTVNFYIIQFSNPANADLQL